MTGRPLLSVILAGATLAAAFPGIVCAGPDWPSAPSQWHSVASTGVSSAAPRISSATEVVDVRENIRGADRSPLSVMPFDPTFAVDNPPSLALPPILSLSFSAPSPAAASTTARTAGLLTLKSEPVATGGPSSASPGAGDPWGEAFPDADLSLGPIVSRLVQATLGVLVLCVISLWILRRTMGVRLSPRPTAPQLRIVETVSLSHRARLQLVEAGGSRFLVGVDQAGLKMITPVAAAFSAELSAALTDATPADADAPVEGVDEVREGPVVPTFGARALLPWARPRESGASLPLVSRIVPARRAV